MFQIIKICILTKTRFSNLSGLVSNFTTFFNNIFTCFPSKDLTDSVKYKMTNTTFFFNQYLYTFINTFDCNLQKPTLFKKGGAHKIKEKMFFLF